MDDTKASRIFWVKCATSAECKTIRIAVSMVMDSWVTALGLRPMFAKPGVCVRKQHGSVILIKSTWFSDTVDVIVGKSR